jgi:hypothetical protein
MSVTINLYNGSLELKLVVKDDYNDFKENYNKIPEKIQVKFTRNMYTKRDAILKSKKKQKRIFKYKNLNQN